MKYARHGLLGLLALQAAALWPTWPWLHARLSDGSGEGWGAAAWLLALFALATRAPVTSGQDASVGDTAPALRGGASTPVASETRRALWLPCVLLIAYAAAYPLCPPLVRAAIGTLSLAATLSAVRLGRAFSWPLAGLLVLGLPLEATLQFYFGYPLRFLVAEASAPVLATLGLDVTAQGTQLAASGLLVEVDGPCSGLKMLRTGLICSCFVALRVRLGTLGWAAHLALTIAALIAANVLRATSLFVLALIAAEPPDFLHAGTGMVAFALVLLLQLLVLRRLPPARLLAAEPRP